MHINIIKLLVGNVTRTCGLDNEWLPAKVYCIREEIDMILTEVGLIILV